MTFLLMFESGTVDQVFQSVIPREGMQPVKGKELLFRVNKVIAPPVNVVSVEMFYHNCSSPETALLPSVDIFPLCNNPKAIYGNATAKMTKYTF